MARRQRSYEVVPVLVHEEFGEEYFPAVGRASTLAGARSLVREAGFRLRLKGYRGWLRRDTPREAPFWSIPVCCEAVANPRKKRVPIVCGSAQTPVYDRHGRQIFVGDRIRVQDCVGPYGAVAQAEGIATQHWELQYCQMPINAGRTVFWTKWGPSSTLYARFHFDPTTERMIGYHRHEDFEHGHETWVEVIR